MKLLLDTHTFLWSLWDPARLSLPAREAYLDPANSLFLSAASYWEICIKQQIGKLTLQPGWDQIFAREMAANGILWLHIDKDHCRNIITLPPIHGDPFDRLLVAQAGVEEMTLVSKDPNIAAYGVATLW